MPLFPLWVFVAFSRLNFGGSFRVIVCSAFNSYSSYCETLFSAFGCEWVCTVYGWIKAWCETCEEDLQVRIGRGLSVRYCALMYCAHCPLFSDVVIVHIGRLLLNFAWERVACWLNKDSGLHFQTLHGHHRNCCYTLCFCLAFANKLRLKYNFFFCTTLNFSGFIVQLRKNKHILCYM
jgi:hypothetical protein